MAGVTISYKGSQITSMTSTGTKTLTTSGQYCEDNITVGYSAPSLESITINAGNLLSQNTTFNSPNLVLYENNSFSKSQGVSTTLSYQIWFDSFIPINFNEKIHLYMNLSLLCSDIDETITVDCDYTVNSSQNHLSFTSSSQNSNIKYFDIYYTSNYLRFGFAKKNGNSETVQITGQVVVTKVVDGIDTINLNLIDNPLYLNIYKSLAYRSTISASVQGVSEWCDSLSVITSQQFMGQPLLGDFVFNNVTSVNQYAFAWNYIGGFTGVTNSYTLTFPKLTSVREYGIFGENRGLTNIYCPLVTSIYGYTFQSCYNLKTISFPSCTLIGNLAFANCPSLTTVSFPSCTSIGNGTFQSCNNLTTTNFPMCASIGDYAFTYCSKLETISFPACTLIGSYAFQSCSNLTTVSFPSCTTINSDAFYKCSNLTIVSFPVCTTINNCAFIYCSKLSQVYFPSCITIGVQTFSGCSNLATANFPMCTSIDNGTFSNCYNLETISFPVCTLISNYAFAYCYSLTTAIFPLCATIGSSAFYKCSNLASVSFPSCTTISSNAFYQCSNLTIVSFPACTTISHYAFSGCSKLSQAYFMGSSIVSIGANIFYFTPIDTSSYLGYFGSIYVPSSLLNSYKTATNWAQYSNRIVGI